MSVCVYTAIAGCYDELRPHVDIPGVDFVAFIDRLDYDDVPGWDIVPFPRSWPYPDSAFGADPRLQAKWFKIVAPVRSTDLGPWTNALWGYEYTIWIDGSHEVTNPAFVDEALADLGPDGFALHGHPHWDCIYQEAQAAMGLAKYAGQPIRQQVDHYRAEGFPEHAGIWACGSMARARSDRLDELMLAWWAEIERWTVEDQISLPVVCRRLGVEPHMWPYWQIDWRWFRFHAHADGTT